MIPTGYLSPAYAESLADFGTPRLLPESGGWVLERDIPGGGGRDAMGCYPLFACRDWSRLHLDLEAIGPGLVSLGLVADPFGGHAQADLDRCFPDRMVPFKQHFVTDLGSVSQMTISKHHRYYGRRALAQMEVEACADPAGFLDDWVALYANLVGRHGLSGIKAFSRDAFARQLRVPGIVVLRAHERGRTLGAHLWYLQGDIAYSHLAAVSERGYELMAAYALHTFALDYFRGRAAWLDLGAGAGVRGDEADGLTRFKRGWATGVKEVYFCGRIFDRARYAAAATSRGLVATDHFPAYRSGEFG